MRRVRSRLLAPALATAAALAAACADTPTAPNATAAAAARRPSFDLLTTGAFYQSFNFAEALTKPTTSFDAFGNPKLPSDWALTAPRDWHPTDFDVAIHLRDQSEWEQPVPFHAMHGPDCLPYQDPKSHDAIRAEGVGSHLVTTYDQLNYRCRNHMMTALKSPSYGVVYVTPNAMVDFSAGEASIKFALATLRVSGRDWVDLWITPWGDNLKLPLEASFPGLPEAPDLQGPPRRAIHVRMAPEPDRYTKSAFEAYYVDDFQERRLPVVTTEGYEKILTPISTRRDTFELKISPTHLSFELRKPAVAGAPANTIRWIDTPIPALPFTRGVVQFGHHSFNPALAWNPAVPTGTGGTWHWDEFTIAPAVPFTILTPTSGRVANNANPTVTFAGPAPAGSYLRFAAYARNLQVSVDGVGWARAVRQGEALDVDGRFHSYWMPVPEGTTAVQFRVPGDANDGNAADNSAAATPWSVRDVTIWSGGPAADGPGKGKGAGNPQDAQGQGGRQGRGAGGQG